MKLALGRVESCPFHPASIRRLKEETKAVLEKHGFGVTRSSHDRAEIPIDYRYLDSLLRAAEDPEVGLGMFAAGVRVGPGVRLPRLPALYPRKKRWRLPRQADPLDYQEGREDAVSVWGRNYSSVEELSDKVLDVLQDQEKRGQVFRYNEKEARELFPNLTVASLGAIREEKPRGVITARVLLDGTHGIAVNHRTRVRDQERAPIAADIKRMMREKSLTNEPIFALTADVSEAHRRVPIDRQDWHLLGWQVRPGEDVFVNTVGTSGVASASYFGYGLHHQSVACASTFQELSLVFGTYWWPMIFTWRIGGAGISGSTYVIFRLV